MEIINEPQFDEVDLNRLYAALEYQLDVVDGTPEWVEEVQALIELRDRIGRMLDGE